jgi:hypothetical protein
LYFFGSHASGNPRADSDVDKENFILLIPSEIKSCAGLILMKTGLNLMPDDNIKPPLNRFQDWKSGSVLHIGLMNSVLSG